MSRLASKRIKRPRRFLAVGLAALLAGCSLIPDAVNPVEWHKGARDLVLGSDDQPRAPEDAPNGPQADPRDGRGQAVPGAGKPIPNLNTVPRRPVTSSREQRAQTQRGLVSDRDGARRYSRDAVRRQGDPVNPLQALPQISPKATSQASPRRSPRRSPMAAAPPPGGVQSLSDFNPAAVRGSYQVATIQFDNGSSRLNARDRRIIRQVFAQQRQTGGTIRIVGHASRRTATENDVRHKEVKLRVSAARADAVARELIRIGARPGSLFVGAVSSRYPRYHEYLPSGEAGNRRAEIFIDF